MHPWNFRGLRFEQFVELLVQFASVENNIEPAFAHEP
jgi:hypothetical protein